MIDRRLLIGLMSAAAAAPAAFSQQAGTPVLKRARTSVLEIAYEESGPEAGFPVLLMHGFPYDPRCFDEVVPPLVAAGYRAIVPYLRGYGQTRFLEADTPRSGQQAALGRDLVELMDALALPSAVLAGFDWGGRAACVAAALWPERVRGLVSANGYNIQDIAGSVAPASPQQEHRLWYQYYFHSERGRAGLQTNRRELCKLLWQLWSPNWKFDDATYARTADSFDNPDFVDVVIHSYRHRFGYAPGDPAYDMFERQLAERPPITVPTVVLHGEGDGIARVAGGAAQSRFFTGPYQYRLIPVIGHDVPQEAPKETVAAVLELLGASR
ncbi:MAG TPA: alpha/beta hydrolase [Xanthobacteraceae bacterium]|nr:alpha/beta hydrolase [Xanthobacteraceae bacterium]